MGVNWPPGGGQPYGKGPGGTVSRLYLISLSNAQGPSTSRRHDVASAREPRWRMGTVGAASGPAPIHTPSHPSDGTLRSRHVPGREALPVLQTVPVVGEVAHTLWHWLEPQGQLKHPLGSAPKLSLDSLDIFSCHPPLVRIDLSCF